MQIPLLEAGFTPQIVY